MEYGATKPVTFEELQKRIDDFFEFPTANRDTVTTTSAILFAQEEVKRASDTLALENELLKIENVLLKNTLEIVQRELQSIKCGMEDDLK